MNSSGKNNTIEQDDGELQSTVEALLSQARGRSVCVRSLKREPSPYATVFPAEVLSMELEDGSEISLFLKRMGLEGSDHPDKQCPEREVRVYEDLLTDQSLPVVKFYGYRWDEAARRRDVYLEYVDDWNLKYHELDHWYTAARRLAHLHAHFAAQVERLKGCEYLLKFDAPYYFNWAHRAVAAVAVQSSELAARLEPMVGNFHGVVEALVSQPETMVHSDPSPKNVLADRSTQPARICFVDWEMAGVGCALLDLVHLKFGLDPDSERKMCETYCSELAGTGLLPSRPQELASLFAACEIHKTVYRLAHSAAWDLPISTLSGWIGDIEDWMSKV